MCTKPHNAAVDVVITVHNMESCVAACLDSLIRQTVPPLHIIIVEDGSTDASATVIDGFAKNDSRFTVISTNGIGAGAARNCGMREVSAPYFMLLDGDDVFHPTMIESLYRAAADGNADIAICDCKERTTQRAPSRTPSGRSSKASCPQPPPSNAGEQ